MAISVPTNVNAEILYAAHKLAKAQAPGNVDTGWIDRTGFDSASILGALGASAGGPATQSLKLELFDADDGSGTNAAQVKPDGVNNDVSTVGATADNTITQHGVAFRNCRKWVKARGVYANTGGTSPTNDVTVDLVLGGARETPTAAPNP